MMKNKAETIPFQTLIEKMPGNVWWKNINLKYLGCNQRVLEVLNLKSLNEFIGKTDYDLWDYEIAKKLEEADHYVLSTGQSLNLEEIIVHADGYHAIMLTNKSPYFDQDGNLAGLIGTSTDITAQKQNEALKNEALKKQNEIAEEKVKTLQNIGARMAHELRTPLATIRMATKNLIEDVNSNDNEIVERFNTILQEVKHAQNLINRMLTNASLKNADLAEFQKYSMAACIQEAITRYPFGDLERNFIQLDIKKDFEFFGVKDLMMHVIFNLMTNAIRAVLKKTGIQQIKLWLDHDNQYHYFHFRDNGNGIPAANQASLFKHFFTTEENGTGLGLAFCKEAVQRFGGDISCISVEGEFTEFVLKFPK